MNVWHMKKDFMPIWVSKEVSGPQQCRNQRKMAVDKDFMAKKLELTKLKDFPLYLAEFPV